MKTYESYYDPPDEEDFPCPNCGYHPDDCICGECPVCDSVGDPYCVQASHFRLNDAKIDRLLKLQDDLYYAFVLEEMQCKAESEWLSKVEEDDDRWGYIEPPESTLVC